MDDSVVSDEAFDQYPWASVWYLVGRLLDCMGITCHQARFSSRTYQTLRHGMYSCLMTHAVLLVFVAVCYISDRSPKSRFVFVAWALLTSWAALFAWLYPRFHRCGWLRVGPSIWIMCLHHLLVVLVSGVALFSGLRIALWSGLNESTVYMLSYICCNVLLSIRCGMGAAIRLVELERDALRTERRAFRQQMANNVITFADILDAQAQSVREEDITAVLEQQPVVVHDPEAFGENSECCICSQAFGPAAEIRQAQCGHFFHSDCLGEWLVRSLTCPLCRENLGQRYRRAAIQLELELARIVGAHPVS